MSLRRRPVPAWAVRRNREREAEARDRAPDVAGTMLDLAGVDIVWSNDTMRAYHPRCRACIPPGPRGTLDMGYVRAFAAEYVGETCAHCGTVLDDTTPTEGGTADEPDVNHR